MKRVRRSYSLLAVIAIGVGTALALATGAQAAVQVKSPPNHVIALEHGATLQANGAAVLVTVDLICPKGASAYVNISVTEAIGDTIANGVVGRSYSGCNGRPQAVSFGAPAAIRPFVRGTAWVQSSMNWYYNGYSRDGWDDHTVNIT
jgi:hypothetical protein